MYARYIGGFMSYVPYAIGGNSVFRISEDIDLSSFYQKMALKARKKHSGM
ncbi:MAG: hypothetical protein OSJ45_07205 [Lachnospiraceae bacterium]|nr:hypothetical protein [Lachnospiraceae bacterium]